MSYSMQIKNTQVLPGIRNMACCAVDDKYIYCTGGNTDDTAGSVNHNTYLYNIDIDYWMNLNIPCSASYGGGQYINAGGSHNICCPPIMKFLDTGLEKKLLLFGGFNNVTIVNGSEEASINRDIYYLDIDANGVAIGSSWQKLETVSLSGSSDDTDRVVTSGELYYDTINSAWALIYTLARKPSSITETPSKLLVLYKCFLTGNSINTKSIIENIYTKFGFTNLGSYWVKGTYLFDTRLYIMITGNTFGRYYTSTATPNNTNGNLYRYDFTDNSFVSVSVTGTAISKQQLTGANNRLFYKNAYVNNPAYNDYYNMVMIDTENTIISQLNGVHQNCDLGTLITDSESFYYIGGVYAVGSSYAEIIANDPRLYSSSLAKFTLTIAPPTLLSISISGVNPLITWKDSATDETDFVVEKRLSTSNDWVRIAIIPSFSVSGTTQMYTHLDTTLDATENTNIYYYRVKTRKVV